MVLGSCHHALGTVVYAARKCVPPNRVRVLQRGSSWSPRHAVHVLASVKLFRELAGTLEGINTRVIVLDALDALRSIDGVILVDADPAEPAWSPVAIDMSTLRANLTLDPPPHPAVVFVLNSTIDDMIAGTKTRGVFDKVLAYAQRLPSSTERDAVHRAVIEHLMGKISTESMRKRTATGKASLGDAHAEMCTALFGDRGVALGKSIRLVLDEGVEVPKAVAATGADAFEVRYVINAAGKFGIK